MLKPADLETLQKLVDLQVETGQQAEIGVSGDLVLIIGTDIKLDHAQMHRLLSVMALRMTHHEDGTGEEFYVISAAGRQILQNPEYLNQLTVAIF